MMKLMMNENIVLIGVKEACKLLDSIPCIDSKTKRLYLNHKKMFLELPIERKVK